MQEKNRQTILIDEDEAMTKAIGVVLPYSHHRLSMWHMNQNALQEPC
jgi:zinc finger SWIM domain-containing protein 3